MHFSSGSFSQWPEQCSYSGSRSQRPCSQRCHPSTVPESGGDHASCFFTGFADIVSASGCECRGSGFSLVLVGIACGNPMSDRTGCQHIGYAVDVQLSPWPCSLAADTLGCLTSRWPLAARSRASSLLRIADRLKDRALHTIDEPPERACSRPRSVFAQEFLRFTRLSFRRSLSQYAGIRNACPCNRV